MSAKNTKNAKVALESVQARFEQWRMTRLKREPIPDELWSAAVELACRYGVCPVAKRLRLNNTSLKERLQISSSQVQRNTLPEDPKVKTTAFIEIPIMANGSDAHCQVDIQRQDGSRMQIRLPHGGGAELSALVGAFMA